MLIQKALEELEIEVAILRRPRIPHCFFQTRPQSSPEHGSKGNGKSHLWAPKNLFGNEMLKRLPQDVLGLTEPQLEAGRDGRHILGETVVEKGGPQLNGRGHGHPVGLHENVIGRHGFVVQELQTLKQAPSSGPRKLSWAQATGSKSAELARK